MRLFRIISFACLNLGLLSLQGCREMASRIFYDQLKGKGDQLMRYPPAPPKDLSPPHQV